MTNDWILDVLTDLQKFSANNRMGRLADYLDDTLMVAAAELSTVSDLSEAVQRREQVRESIDPCFSGHSA